MESSINLKLLGGYESFVKSLVFYNQYYGGIFGRLSEEKLEELSYGTYENICLMEGEYGEKDLMVMFGLGRKLMEIFGGDWDDKIWSGYKGRVLSFYDLFCVFCGIFGRMEEEGNNLIKFIRCIINFNFKEYKNINPLIMESLLFVQRLLNILDKVIRIHRKRIMVMRRLRY